MADSALAPVHTRSAFVVNTVGRRADVVKAGREYVQITVETLMLN